MTNLEVLGQLKQLGVKKVSFPHGTMLATYSEVLWYSVGGSPSNLLVFCFKEVKDLKNDQNTEL